MKKSNAYVLHYRLFMVTFEKHYPELYAKYKFSILLPAAGNERISIDSKIAPGSSPGIILAQMIKEYYTTIDN